MAETERKASVAEKHLGRVSGPSSKLSNLLTGPAVLTLLYAWTPLSNATKRRSIIAAFSHSISTRRLSAQKGASKSSVATHKQPWSPHQEQPPGSSTSPLDNPLSTSAPPSHRPTSSVPPPPTSPPSSSPGAHSTRHPQPPRRHLTSPLPNRASSASQTPPKAALRTQPTSSAQRSQQTQSSDSCRSRQHGSWSAWASSTAYCSRDWRF